MDAAVAALIGAGVGAIVPAAASVFSSRSSRQDAREARLFGHRREAYARFLSQARSSREAAVQWYWEGEGRTGQEPPEDALDPLHNALAEVSLYGTPQTDRLAVAAFKAVVEFTFNGDSEANNLAALDAIDAFVAQARIDLGTPK